LIITIISTNISKEAINCSELLSSQTTATSPHHCTIAFKADNKGLHLNFLFTTLFSFVFSLASSPHKQ